MQLWLLENSNYAKSAEIREKKRAEMMFSARLLELTWKRSLGYYKSFNCVKRAVLSENGVKLGYKTISNFAVLGSTKLPIWVKTDLKLRTWNGLRNVVLASTKSLTTVNVLIWAKTEQKWQLSLCTFNSLKNAVFSGTISALVTS